MATFSSYDIVKKMIDEDGYYVVDGVRTEDPQPIAIFEYLNCAAGEKGKICWMVGYVVEDVDAMFQSPFVHNPKLLWDRVEGKHNDPTKPESEGA